MKIGFDLAQTSLPLAGCGWYAHTLLDAMANAAPQVAFLGYRHFAYWLNDPANQAPMPVRPNVVDYFAWRPREDVIAAWQESRVTGIAPGAPQLVHSTSFQAPRFTQAKLVVTVFDLSFWAVSEYTTDRIRLDCQAGVLAALEHAHGLIFISEHARREFERFLPNYRRQGELASIVTPLAARWPSPGMAAAPTGDYWLVVGSLEPRKNLENLLAAYEDYARDHVAPKPLWLVGSGGWKNERILARLRPLEERGLARRLGFVPDEQMVGLYQKAHALIFPSWYEGFGLPVLEAMTLGCPVICSDHTSLPEIGDDAVHYIDPASPATIAEAMRKLEWDLVQRDRLRHRAVVQAAKFSWQQTAKLTLAFYDRILSAG
ncbi:MAG: glycosyltransferase family 1 protein [Lacunisphaera sp.]